MNLQNLKGIGEKTVEHLYASNIYTIEDLLTYYPYKYQILEPAILETSETNTVLTINATVVDTGKVSFIRKNFNTYRFKVETHGKILTVAIFNRAFIKPRMTVGRMITLIGKYDAKKNTFTANDIKLNAVTETKIIPIYHAIKGLKNNTLEKIIKEALKEKDTLYDYVPEEFNQ